MSVAPPPHDASGYLSDVTYPDRFHRELSPTWLNYVALQAGAIPPSLDAAFTYLDLGCGFAHSTIINACAFPHAEFHACDFNPAHISAAVRHAQRLGARNVRFHEVVFEELLQRELPAFDFIVLHGVYSWVGSDVRKTILRILSERLKPGGLVYISYNCLPGWSAEAPLRKLMLELAAVAEPGDTQQQAKRALATLEGLSHVGFKYFREAPAAVEAIRALSQSPANYVAHEYLNGAWELFYSIDVADALAAIGAAFVGSGTLADNYPRLRIDAHSAEAIAKLPTERLRQLATDFAVNQRFRRDVFLRAPSARAIGSSQDALSRFDKVVVGCVTEIEQIETKVAIPRGTLSFQLEFVVELQRLLARGAMQLGELVTALAGGGRNVTEIRQNIVFMVAAGVLTPFATAHAHASETSQAIVDRVLAGIVETGNAAIVPCQQLGNGVLVSVGEAQLALEYAARSSTPSQAPSRLIRLGLLRAHS